MVQYFQNSQEVYNIILENPELLLSELKEDIVQNMKSKIIKKNMKLSTDINFSYKFHKNYTFLIGADNIFDVYPTIQEPYTTDTGGPWESVQQGFSGAFFFTRFAFNF